MRAILLIIAAVLSLMFFKPAETAVQPMVASVPSATPSLPVCVTEDGTGQALCTWDAKAQGNGKGTSMISGDCALDITGDENTQSVCLNTYAHVVDGSNAVQECNDMRREAMGKNGWTLKECYQAFNKEW